MSSPVAIVNPYAAAGKTHTAWPAIQAKLEAKIGPVKVLRTEAPGHATVLAREALDQGAEWLIAVGGDGTLNEVVNGMIVNDQPHHPEAVLSVIMCGTGGDFRKSLGLKNTLDGYLKALSQGSIRTLDLGKVTLTAPSGQTLTRYFINISSFGMGGDVVHRIENQPLLKSLGGQAGFLLATLSSLCQFKPQRLRLRIDQTLDWQVLVLQVAVANGRVHGGGMLVAPEAELDDGWFDLIILTGIGPLQAAITFPRVYRGQHLSAPAVRHLRCRSLQAEPLGKEPVWLELDGEALGRLPAQFEILPRRLRIKA